MRLRQLEYFVAICEAGSVNRAANELRVAQPSLSQQIQALDRNDEQCDDQAPLGRTLRD